MRTYELTADRGFFVIKGKKYVGVTLYFRKMIHPKQKQPKSYKEIGGFRCNERGAYESGEVTIYKTKGGHAASMYRDGCFYPYYAKCVLNPA